jgi:hypothetical protein
MDPNATAKDLYAVESALMKEYDPVTKCGPAPDPYTSYQMCFEAVNTGAMSSAQFLPAWPYNRDTSVQGVVAVDDQSTDRTKAVLRGCNALGIPHADCRWYGRSWQGPHLGTKA